MITLLSGGQVDESGIVFNETTYHFLINGNDVTDDIRRADKIALVANFDVTRDNYRLSAEKGGGARYGQEPLNESTTSILADQLIHDPLGAPIEALNSGIKQLWSSTGVKVALAVGLVALVIYVAYRAKK